MRYPKSILVLCGLHLAGSAEAVVGHDPDVPADIVECARPNISAEWSSDLVRYRGNGSCRRAQSETFSWRMEGAYQPSTKQTQERVWLSPSGYTSHPIDVTSKWTGICDLDPWINGRAVACQDRLQNVQGTLAYGDALFEYLRTRTLPVTAANISQDMRLTLKNAQLAAQRAYAEEQRRLAEEKRQKMIAGLSSQTLRAPSTSTTRSGAGSGALLSSDGGARTDTVSSAHKLQGAPEQQHLAKASPSAATQTSVAGRFAGAATGATPSPEASPPAGAGASPGIVLVEPRPNTVVQGSLRVRADIALAALMPKRSIVEVVQVSAPAMSGTGTTQPRPLQRVSVEVATADLAQGTGISMPRGAEAAGQWRVRARYSSSAAAWSREVFFQYVAYPDAKDPAAAKAGGQLERQALNPQPLPPKPATSVMTTLPQAQTTSPATQLRTTTTAPRSAYER